MGIGGIPVPASEAGWVVRIRLLAVHEDDSFRVAGEHGGVSGLSETDAAASGSVEGRAAARGAALDTLAEGLLILDQEGRIALANRAFAAVLGCEPDKLMVRGRRNCRGSRIYRTRSAARRWPSFPASGGAGQ